jgi:hypothetical protein
MERGAGSVQGAYGVAAVARGNVMAQALVYYSAGSTNRRLRKLVQLQDVSK